MENEKLPEVDFFADLLDTLEIDELIDVDNLLLSVYKYDDPDT